MAKSSTSLTTKARAKLKPRGKSNKTLILNAIREASLLDLDKRSSNETVETAFFKHIATTAFDAEDMNRGMCLKLMADKGWASLKPSNDLVTFDFDNNALPHIQAGQVMTAAANGLIPTDIANTFIQSIKAMIDIEEYTDLKDRIDKLEKALNGNS